MNNTSLKSRNSYPFVVSDGTRSLLQDSVDDLVIWLDPSVPMPLNVTASVINGVLTLNISDDMFTIDLMASESSDYVYDADGSISGAIKWDSDGLLILKSTILGNDPHPYSTVYVHPSACVPYKKPPLSSVTINGNECIEDVIHINADTYKDNPDSGISVDAIGSTGRSFNVYNVDHINSDKPLDCIIIESRENPDNSVIISNINGDVWLNASAESDIRVVTDDTILITEVSNDRL